MLLNWKQLKTDLMLPQLAASAIETALAQLLRRTEHYQPYLRNLNSKILKLHLNQPEMSCYFVFSLQHIDVLHHYEGEVDCSVHTFAQVVLKMPRKAELTQYLNDKSIVLYGDLQVLQDFLSLLDFLQKNPAELLSPYLGDVVAYNTTRFMQQGMAFLSSRWQRSREHSAERLTEEWQLAAAKPAVADFNRQVNELMAQSERLEQRFQHLLHKLEITL